MADGDYRIGLDGQFLFGAAGNPATTEITNVQDVTLDLSAIEADTKTRASRTWATSKVVLLQGSVQFTMLDKEGDIALAAIKARLLFQGQGRPLAERRGQWRGSRRRLRHHRLLAQRAVDRGDRLQRHGQAEQRAARAAVALSRLQPFT